MLKKYHAFRLIRGVCPAVDGVVVVVVVVVGLLVVVRPPLREGDAGDEPSMGELGDPPRTLPSPGEAGEPDTGESNLLPEMNLLLMLVGTETGRVEAALGTPPSPPSPPALLSGCCAPCCLVLTPPFILTDSTVHCGSLQGVFRAASSGLAGRHPSRTFPATQNCQKINSHVWIFTFVYVSRS